MARRRKEDAEKTRTRILASALSLFAKKGYEHTTFTDIAARLKLTKGAVYWHFESKEKLLSALVSLALEKFRSEIKASMPDGELTFMGVANMMLNSARRVTEIARSEAFFRLMKCQVKWADESMSAIRNDLLNGSNFGPKEAFKRAIAHEIKMGRIRSDVSGEEIASICLAMWDGVVQSKLDHFLQGDLQKTLIDGFQAVWDGIRVRTGDDQK